MRSVVECVPLIASSPVIRPRTDMDGRGILRITKRTRREFSLVKFDYNPCRHRYAGEIGMAVANAVPRPGHARQDASLMVIHVYGVDPCSSGVIRRTWTARIRVPQCLYSSMEDTLLPGQFVRYPVSGDSRCTTRNSRRVQFLLTNQSTGYPQATTSGTVPNLAPFFLVSEARQKMTTKGSVHSTCTSATQSSIHPLRFPRPRQVKAGHVATATVVNWQASSCQCPSWYTAADPRSGLPHRPFIRDPGGQRPAGFASMGRRAGLHVIPGCPTLWNSRYSDRHNCYSGCVNERD